MFYIYILKSNKDNKTYVGYTNNLEERLKKHNSGQVKSTKFRRPLDLLFSEEFNTSIEARKRELYWKNGGGRRKLKQILRTI
ncbi:MAG: endonuclease [Candidatus Yanofskybacteria bacterium CG10_big_fil_rev_8_21_14_0_10_46_23]|uniref:Endonuclease n=1 Tax=Candidatus Yanofskybacteria bacterium CG10_big_fil_rev_8_21_14_0_10_46_23 TaxID=1975098 RepID=A0A2H0R4M1_9BACT|nr:MAG: endonuclease [Candidatus Yanofskybacteria bacterium CG10_big_fil_rev_8_21_14_0_10_46_23]